MKILQRLFAAHKALNVFKPARRCYNQLKVVSELTNLRMERGAPDE
jgi:hypothetical protein